MTSNNKTPTTGLTIGLDLGDRRHAVCVLNTRGHIIAEETLPNTRASLEQLSQRYPRRNARDGNASRVFDTRFGATPQRHEP